MAALGRGWGRLSGLIGSATGTTGKSAWTGFKAAADRAESLDSCSHLLTRIRLPNRATIDSVVRIMKAARWSEIAVRQGVTATEVVVASSQSCRKGQFPLRACREIVRLTGLVVAVISESGPTNRRGIGQIAASTAQERGPMLRRVTKRGEFAGGVGRGSS